MLTINPSINSNNYVNTFKAKANYQQIYEEMGKLTIQTEEKILKKTNVCDKFKNLKNNLKDFFSQIDGDTLTIYSVILFGIAAIATLYGKFLYTPNQGNHGTDGCVSPEQYYQQGKMDALRKLHDEKTISHDVFMKYINEMNN